MTCMYCKGRMERGTAPFQIDRKGYHLTLEEVPAWVCTQCGEPYFEKREVDRIQAAISEIDRRAEQLAASC
ncbi:MAG: YgiT-type zinc finger protein [Planctomycetota bacterium]